jgi:hypothetical protein
MSTSGADISVETIIIVGCVCGGVVVVLFTILGVACCRRRRRQLMERQKLRSLSTTQSSSPVCSSSVDSAADLSTAAKLASNLRGLNGAVHHDLPCSDSPSPTAAADVTSSPAGVRRTAPYLMQLADIRAQNAYSAQAFCPPPNGTTPSTRCSPLYAWNQNGGCGGGTFGHPQHWQQYNGKCEMTTRPVAFYPDIDQRRRCSDAGGQSPGGRHRQLLSGSAVGGGSARNSLRAVDLAAASGRTRKVIHEVIV